MSRAIDDARAATRSAAAALAALATSLAEASAEPAPDARALRHVALTVQALGHRAAVVASGATFTAGQLVAYAVAATEAHDAAVRTIEAEAERDAFLYVQDRRDNAATCPTAEQWAREGFQGNWDDEWRDGLGVERAPAEATYGAAFARAVAKLDAS